MSKSFSLASSQKDRASKIPVGLIGSGYLGSATAFFLQNKGYPITVSTTTPARLPYLKKDFKNAIILEGSRVSDWYQVIHSHSVLVLAVAPKTAIDSYADTYLASVKALLTALEKKNSVTQIIYISSTSVYGSHMGCWVDEESALLNPNPQAIILKECEERLLSAAIERLKVVIFRLAEIYGPNREIEKRVINSSSIPFAGDGSNFTNLIHVEDAVRAIDMAIENELSGVYNLANDFHVQRKDFYSDICKKHSLPEVQWDFRKATHHGGNRKVSNRKIKSIGFTFLHPTIP